MVELAELMASVPSRVVDGDPVQSELTQLKLQLLNVLRLLLMLE
jgi:hypothetical protein